MDYSKTGGRYLRYNDVSCRYCIASFIIYEELKNVRSRFDD